MDDIMKSITAFLSESVVSGALKIIGGILILVIGFKLVNVCVNHLIKSVWFKKLDVTIQNFSKNFLSIMLKAVVIVTMATLLGVPTASVVAVLGSAGLAVGLALQGGLANIAGGFIVLMFKPFLIGDYITSGVNAGTVSDIGIFYTTITTPDNKKIVIPNGTLANSPLTNYSSNSTRRLDLTFGVAYSTDIDKVKKVLIETASNHPLILKAPEPVAFLSKHDSSAIEFLLRVWSNNEDYWAVNFEIMEQVKRNFDNAGIEIPYSQIDIHMK